MPTDPPALPLHSRALTVALGQRADASLDANAVLLDLRKRGFVPVGGDLGTPGIVHHMLVDAVIDPRGPTITTIAARQPSVAFEPSALTGGESCRDPAGRVAGLAGVRVDAAFAKHLSSELGGPLCCSHLLTLSQLLGSTVAWALGDGGARGVDAQRRAGERVFRRDITVDVRQLTSGALDFAAQLTDLYFAPAAAMARPMDRFAAVHEVRVVAEIDMAGVIVTRINAAERRRGHDHLAQETWSDRTERAAVAVGLSLFRGVSAALLTRLGDVREDRPLLDTMLMLAPTFIQACAAMSDKWPAAAARADSLVGMAGMLDSCYMWRRGGALDRARTPDDPAPVL